MANTTQVVTHSSRTGVVCRAKAGCTSTLKPAHSVHVKQNEQDIGVRLGHRAHATRKVAEAGRGGGERVLDFATQAQENVQNGFLCRCEGLAKREEQPKAKRDFSPCQPRVTLLRYRSKALWTVWTVTSQLGVRLLCGCNTKLGAGLDTQYMYNQQHKNQKN